MARTLCIQLAGGGGHRISQRFIREQMPNMLETMELKDTEQLRLLGCGWSHRQPGYQTQLHSLVGTGQISPTPSSQGPSSSGRKGPPEVRSTIQGTPSCTRRERPRRCSGAQAPGWWSTAGASSPPRLPSPWLTPSSALRTLSPSFTPCASTPRACSWKPMPSSAPWAAEPGSLGCPAGHSWLLSSQPSSPFLLLLPRLYQRQQETPYASPQLLCPSPWASWVPGQRDHGSHCNADHQFSLLPACPPFQAEPCPAFPSPRAGVALWGTNTAVCPRCAAGEGLGLAVPGPCEISSAPEISGGGCWHKPGCTMPLGAGCTRCLNLCTSSGRDLAP
ncbi:uncharacterized protein LOC128136282 isoform X8 [Harpia harpyja]|uniref:uncharacterized protein LOC128136282 isoform X8 n=1 Tax=Harpia harpyja TaxID=202280 RepID=UPI0022B11BA0|nr:uncharacterized protein LOC128136282 isoform X8 [Harpia harpyja]